MSQFGFCSNSNSHPSISFSHRYNPNIVFWALPGNSVLSLWIIETTDLVQYSSHWTNMREHECECMCWTESEKNQNQNFVKACQRPLSQTSQNKGYYIMYMTGLITNWQTHECYQSFSNMSISNDNINQFSQFQIPLGVSVCVCYICK